MSIRKYIAYLRTVETGSITQSARELGYTQSAVSKMLADLEAEWNVTLLTRNHSGIELTSEGLELLPAVQDIVKSYNDLNFAVSELHGGQSGMLRLGCFTSFFTSILPPVLRSFHEKYPNIQIQLMGGEYNEIAEWLRRGTVDCGFLAMPAGSDFDVTFMFQDSFVIILPEGHPMAGEPCYPLARLPEESYVRLKEMQDYEIDRFLEGLDHKPNITYEVTSDFALLPMVECGLGVSIVHDLLLRPNRYHVVRLPLDITQFRNIGLATKNGVTPSSITKLFIDHIVSCKKRGAFLDSLRDIRPGGGPAGGVADAGCPAAPRD